MISKETFKTFLIYFLAAGFVILCINTFIMVNNQATILENQGKGLPIVNDTNQKINDIDDRLIDLAQKVD
jgi:hypothetical protein